MLKTHLEGERHSFTQADFHRFADCTDGYSGSDIAAVAQDALYQPFRLTNAARFFRYSSYMWQSCLMQQIWSLNLCDHGCLLSLTSLLTHTLYACFVSVYALFNLC